MLVAKQRLCWQAGCYRKTLWSFTFKTVPLKFHGRIFPVLCEFLFSVILVTTESLCNLAQVVWHVCPFSTMSSKERHQGSDGDGGTAALRFSAALFLCSRAGASPRSPLGRKEIKLWHYKYGWVMRTLSWM